MSSLRIEALLSELQQLPTRRFYFACCSDWYSHQELASYVRVVSALRTPEPCTLMSFVAWVLSKDPTWPDKEPEVWLPNCTLTVKDPCEIDRIFHYLQPNRGALDTSNLPYGWDEEIPLNPCIIAPNALEGVVEIYGIDQARAGESKRRYGPTHIYFWERGEWLFYIESHSES